jgi:hypothetical protein
MIEQDISTMANETISRPTIIVDIKPTFMESDGEITLSNFATTGIADGEIINVDVSGNLVDATVTNNIAKFISGEETFAGLPQSL